MIVRICEDTPKLHLRVSQPGCDGAQLLGMVELIIQPPACEQHERVHYEWDGCGYQPVVLPPDIPTLRYPAFEIDDDGRVVFYFDKKLWSLPNGRYNATVVVEGCCNNLTFGIDLCNRPLEIDQVAVTPATTCGDTEC